MYTKKRPFFLIAQTPVHAGSGSDLGVIDLPIQRESHTGFPKIEASGIKGVFREFFTKSETDMDKKVAEILFGPEEGDAHQSAIGFIDARILFFPVKSVKGIFAWVTCLDCLAKFNDMLNFSGLSIGDKDGPIDLGSSGLSVSSITANSSIAISKNGDLSVVLEEYPQIVTENALLTRFAKWFSENILSASGLGYQSEKFKTSLVILDSQMFAQFVKHSTEVIPRIRINSDKGTVQKGALWYEEYLPVETILYSTLLSSQPMIDSDTLKKHLEHLKDTDGDIYSKAIALENSADNVMQMVTSNFPSIIQIGGNATLGKGFMKPVLFKKEEDNAR